MQSTSFIFTKKNNTDEYGIIKIKKANFFMNTSITVQQCIVLFFVNGTCKRDLLNLVFFLNGRPFAFRIFTSSRTSNNDYSILPVSVTVYRGATIAFCLYSGSIFLPQRLSKLFLVRSLWIPHFSDSTYCLYRGMLLDDQNVSPKKELIKNPGKKCHMVMPL